MCSCKVGRTGQPRAGSPAIKKNKKKQKKKKKKASPNPFGAKMAPTRPGMKDGENGLFSGAAA